MNWFSRLVCGSAWRWDRLICAWSASLDALRLLSARGELAPRLGQRGVTRHVALTPCSSARTCRPSRAGRQVDSPNSCCGSLPDLHRQARVTQLSPCSWGKMYKKKLLAQVFPGLAATFFIVIKVWLAGPTHPWPGRQKFQLALGLRHLSQVAAR